MKCFLIVDDDPLICENIVSKLTRLHYDQTYNIITANNATDAFILVQKHHPELIITDIRMNTISGLGLIEKIHSINFYPKIFVLSGYDDFDYVRKAFLLGVCDYMLKPVDIQELDAKLQTALVSANSGGAAADREEKPQPEADGSLDIMDAALRYIDENLSQNITMKDVSDNINISYYYFSRLLKQKTNKNFSEYVHMRRIELAREYLKDPSFTISEIAYKLGYTNQNQFSRVFKRYCGEYPTIYRQQQNSES